MVSFFLFLLQIFVVSKAKDSRDMAMGEEAIASTKNGCRPVDSSAVVEMDWTSSSKGEVVMNTKNNEIKIFDTLLDVLVCLRQNQKENVILFPRGRSIISFSDAESLAFALSENTSLFSLALEEVHLSSLQGIQRIAAAVMRHPRIQRLTLFDNRLGDEGVAVLMNVLVNPGMMTVISHERILCNDYYQLFCRYNMSPETNFSHLQTLCLCGNKIGDRGAYWIAQALDRKRTISELDLSSNEITDQGTYCLAEMLSRSTMTAFILNGNHAGVQGALAIARAVQYNQSLEVLGLCGNGIGDEGAIHVSQVAKTHCRLKALLLEDNGITERGILAVADAHRQNSRLGMMEISWNFCSIIAMQSISASIQNLMYLYLDRCEVGDAHMEILSNALRTNQTIRDLFLEGNQISFNGIQHLSFALKENDCLEGVFLDGNRITRRGATLLCQVLKTSNARLQRLQIHDDYHDIQRELDVYLDLNGVGRKCVLKPTFSPVLWPIFLVQKEAVLDPDLIFLLVRERPDLFQ